MVILIIILDHDPKGQINFLQKTILLYEKRKKCNLRFEYDLDQHPEHDPEGYFKVKISD